MTLGSYLCVNCETRPIENRDTGYCATCSAIARKASKQALAEPKKRKAIPKRSDKKVALDKEYSALRKVFLAEYPMCQCSVIWYTGLCTKPSSQVHHTSMSSLNYLNTETWIAVCAECHNFIERSMSAVERREKGLLRD